jgi:hypothetical protein
MAVITQTGSRNWLKSVRRVMDSCWFGTSNDAEQLPLALNNESILAVNAAGTGTVALIKADASNVVTLPTGATVPAGQTLTVAGTLATTGGASAVGAFPWVWAAGYVPVATTTGNNTTVGANTQYVGPVWVEANTTITGVAFLIGTTGGTDKAIVALYNNAGTLLANSSVSGSGTTVGTGSTLQSIAFSGTYAAIGPARYWVSVQYSGTTAKLQTVPLGTAFCATGTNATATPAASFTVPTSFNANVCPVASLY